MASLGEHWFYHNPSKTGVAHRNRPAFLTLGSPMHPFHFEPIESPPEFLHSTHDRVLIGAHVLRVLTWHVHRILALLALGIGSSFVMTLREPLPSHSRIRNTFHSGILEACRH